MCFDVKIRYLGIEPSPSVFSSLKHNVPNQTIYNKGLWNQEKTIEFYISDLFGDSSIIPINNYKDKIDIKTITLGKIIEGLKSNVKLIKLEAEGAEPEILDGLRNFLKNVEYISVDAGFERGYEAKSTVPECVNYLLKNNFDLINYGKNRVVLLFKNNSFIP